MVENSHWPSSVAKLSVIDDALASSAGKAKESTYDRR